MSGETGDEIGGKAGWLRDEPATWHELNQALQDVTILLQYLGELPDARLLGCFADTRGKPLEGSAGRQGAPPCGDYKVFLRRLFQIAAAFQTGRADLLPAEDQGSDGANGCSAVAFVYWSRDFLSAVAAPATAESIRLTRAFLVKRSWSLNPFLRMAAAASPAAGPALPVLPPDRNAPTRNRLAGKLASRLFIYESLTIGVILLTVVTSIYALSGQLILTNERAMRDAWSTLDARLEAEEEKAFAAPNLPVTAEGRARFEVTGLCDLTREAGEPGRSQVADSGTVRNDASPAPAPPKLYAMPRQAHLCADRAKALLDLFVVTVHLQSWSSAITESFAGRLGLPFGVVPSTLNAYAEGNRGCFGLRPSADGAGLPPCDRILFDEIDRSRHVAESILGAVTQYLLPVLYAFLGAMAAALRHLRRKVDASLLSYTDRPRIQQRAILGVLCGAIIGLFASLLTSAGGVGNIGVSAVALLAGYNVDGVFRFLDELSDRLFRPNTPARPG